MGNTTTSPNMGLTLPIVSQQTGPDYATNVNTSLTAIDSHNHAPGQGVQITPSGININADLQFNVNNATTLRTTRFTPQGAPISSSSADVCCAYVAGSDLYYNDITGNVIRLTQNGSVAGAVGSIGNLVAPASATYVVVSTKFVWQSDVNTAADLDARNIILRNAAASSNGLTLQPPAAMAGNFSITFPNVPASQSFMTLDNSGTIATPAVYPLPTAGIANLAVTRTKLSAVGQVTSSASGAFSTANTVDDLVIQTVPLSIISRPVMIFTQASINGATSFLQAASAGPTLSAIFSLERTLGSGSASVILAQYELGVFDNQQESIIPSSCLQYMDTVGSGTYTYQLFARVTGASGTAGVTNVRLVAYEL